MITKLQSLKKSEQAESMYTTWGRIRSRVLNYTDDPRLKALVQKFNTDFGNARVEENHFK